MLGITLFFLALVLAVLMALPALVHTLVGSWRHRGGWTYINDAFMAGAHAIDVYGNVAYATILNDLFLKKGGYHYGKRGETISSATGRNWAIGKLNWLGLGLCGLLNWIDKDHCWKSIEGGREGLKKPKPVPWYYTAAFTVLAAGLLGANAWFWWWVIF